MSRRLKELIDSLDLSDVRLIIVGCILILLPLFYLFMFTGINEEPTASRRIAITDMGNQSAFNLTSTSKPSSGAGSAGVPVIAPKTEKVESELDRAWQKMQSVPKSYQLPADIPVETRQMIEAEDDPEVCEGNSLLDRCEFAAAEKIYKSAISNAGSNHFKELFAWGGLMEVYQLEGNQTKFREAFANYAKTAQKLQHVYGPLADNVARAYQMFEQLSHVDSGKLREYLTRSSLESGVKVSYEEFMKGINQTKEWFPSNLPTPPGTIPEMMQPGSGG